MRRLRAGVVGAGRWAVLHHLPALVARPEVDVVGIAEPDAARAAGVAERFAIPVVRSNWAELYAAVDLDLVVVATPAAHHHDPARAAMEAGIHVLVEKPLTVDPGDAWDLVARAERHGVHLVVGYTFLFTPHAAVVRDLVAGGGVGELLLATGLYSSAMEHLYAGTWPGDSDDPLAVPVPATFADAALSGGGQAANQATHALASMISAVGDAPGEVGARMRPGPGGGEGALDLVDVLGLAWDGALGSLASTGSLAPGQPPQWELRYYGTEGAVLVDLAAGTLTHLPGVGEAREVTPLPVDGVYPTRAPATTLVDLVLERTEVNPAPGVLGAQVVEVVAAAYRSAAAGGRPVAVGRAGGPDRR